jgi:hypothetical protein
MSIYSHHFTCVNVSATPRALIEEARPPAPGPSVAPPDFQFARSHAQATVPLPPLLMLEL